MARILNFNQKIATKKTSFVSTMWCAYIFAAIALISLPAAIKTGESIVIITWVAQTFLHLVLLSIIMVVRIPQPAGCNRKLMKPIASIVEFELAKQSQEIANKEMTQLKDITSVIHRLVKEIEKRNK